MNLYLLRHGIAEDLSKVKTGQDCDRCLTAEGASKTATVARAAEALGCRFDHILTSPYKRASRTAEIFHRIFKPKRPPQPLDALKPDADFAELIAGIRRCSGASNLLLVGHEPFLSRFASVLVTGSPVAAIRLKKAGLCKLSVEATVSGRRCATLQWLLTPRIAKSIVERS